MSDVTVPSFLALAVLAAFFLYSYIIFYFAGRLLGRARAKYLPILLLGVLNVGIIYALSFLESSSTPLAYFGIYLLLMAEMWLLYRPDFRLVLFLVITFILHIMVFHTVSVVALAWAQGQSIYAAANSLPNIYLAAIISTSALSFATLLFMLLVPLPKVRIVMQNSNQRMYQTVWMSICALYLLYNANIFQQNITSQFLYLDQILKCGTILLGAYVMLFYNFRVSMLLGYKEKSEDLTSQLNTNLGYLDAVTGKQGRKYAINLTQDSFREGLPEESKDDTQEWKRFSTDFLPVARNLLYGEDLPGFLAVMNQKHLLELYAQGRRELVLDYRMYTDGQNARWNRLNLSLMQEEETGDILVFAYSQDVQEEYEEKQELYKKAQLDLMTGVYNRATFETLAAEEMKQGPGVLLMLDMDHFKPINDLLGHDTGDEVLRQVARLLKTHFRERDLVGRFGGDEFMVYVKGLREAGPILPQVENLLKEATLIFKGPNGEELTTTLSIGIAELTAAGTPFATAYKQADTALYLAKNRGKNCYSLYRPGAAHTEG